MKYFFSYNKDDGRIASYAEGENVVPENFAQIELDITDDDLALLQQNYEAFIKDDALVLRKSAQIVEGEKNQDIEDDKETLRQKIDNGTVTLEDLGNFILKIT